MDLVAYTVSRLPLPLIKKISQSQFAHPALKRAYGWAAGWFRNRDQTIMGGVGKGLRFNPGMTNAGYVLGTNDPEVQVALAAFLKPGAVFYDIGANVGFLTVLGCRLVGPGGRVISVEPFPETVKRLEHNVQINQFENVTVFTTALSAREGTARFLILPEPTLSKLVDCQKPNDPVVGETEVRVRRLDDLCAEAKLPMPDVVKIDVEGAEADVLLGGAEIFKSARPLMLIELHGTNDAVAVRLDELGYRYFVLGSTDSIQAAPYWAFVLAAPAERPEQVALAERVAGSSKTLR